MRVRLWKYPAGLAVASIVMVAQGHITAFAVFAAIGALASLLVEAVVD